MVIRRILFTCLRVGCGGSPEPVVLCTFELDEMDLGRHPPVGSTFPFPFNFFSLSFRLKWPVMTSGMSCEDREFVKRLIGPLLSELGFCCIFGFNHEWANGFAM